MKFVCLFFAVVFLGIAQSDEADGQKQWRKPLEDWPGLQGPDPALPADYDEALKDEEDVPCPKIPIYCITLGGRCRHRCGQNEKLVGRCFSTRSCCVRFQ
ncbi:Hypothetical predicted protein [Podarcis lilfordi]|uniref:Beta-defensin n=1 Tax=Podarcis lilfordi TaxID=74358 RepID=A0AA35P4J9_9SAUR|nr:Hypothetical predicted protein [Podarcis lilfordi]